MQVQKYNNLQLYSSNMPLKVFDYINNNPEKIHYELFDDAINKYFIDNNLEKSLYKIIDLMDNNNYLLPSTALLISKNNNKSIKVDLKDYWNINYITYENKIDELLISDDNKKHVDLDYVNYVEGNLSLVNKFTNKKFYINFDKLQYLPDKSNKLSNTFSKIIF